MTAYLVFDDNGPGIDEFYAAFTTQEKAEAWIARSEYPNSKIVEAIELDPVDGEALALGRDQ